MLSAVRSYVHSLGLDAYVVGGAVRDELLGIAHKDEDFLVPALGQEELRAALRRYGRVEDLMVHGQLVGVRLFPRDRAVSELVPAGIELSPPRAERSTGPGHRDFEIVADAAISIEEDMQRRDFTVNAMARRLATGELVDPFGGVSALARRELRTVTPNSFLDDPLRLLRALRLVSELGFDLAGETVAEMRRHATGIRHVAPERIGGGIAADGQGELSRLLLGGQPARALRLARDTGVLAGVLPELEATIGYRIASPRQPLTLDEHLIVATQHASDTGAPLRVRLAALLHDVAKPRCGPTDDHAIEGALMVEATLDRLRYPVRLQRGVARLVAAHSFELTGSVDGMDARRFLAAHGDEAAFDLVALKAADLATKTIAPEESEALARLRRLLEQERASPHRISDLAVDGDDLLALGFAEGPEIGEMLATLLDEVLADPAANDRGRLLARAREVRR
jgi:tRNA nucleotidyltransferase (CCA-adding enzyme)